jgi:hypothetical protein
LGDCCRAARRKHWSLLTAPLKPCFEEVAPLIGVSGGRCHLLRQCRCSSLIQPCVALNTDQALRQCDAHLQLGSPFQSLQQNG